MTIEGQDGKKMEGKKMKDVFRWARFKAHLSIAPNSVGERHYPLGSNGSGD
jgi:hypothetical protein